MELNNEKDMRFYKLLEQLVTAMTDYDNVDKPHIESLLIEISSMLRLSKGVTHVFRNPQEEKAGIGEVLCCYDLGIEGKPVMTIRMVSSVMSIVTMTVFMSPDEPPLTPEERQKVELTIRTTLSFLSHRRLRDIVYNLAYFDDNGYPNLRSLSNYLNKMLIKQTYRGKAAIRYNLRHFSLVNQEIGRNAGDYAIRSHYNSVKNIVGDSGEVFRLGGDNFVAICSQDRLEKLLPYLTEANVVYSDEGECTNISTSAGYFCIPGDAVLRTQGDIMERIITAFQFAQSGGKEHIVCHNEELDNQKKKSMRVQQLFPDAVRNEEFHVFYQPKVDINTGKLCGAEALCRWFKNGNIVPPKDFIPVLEETSDICKLDLYMLDHVCQDIRRWLDNGFNVVRVSVNLSRKHMMNAKLPETIIEIIDKHKIPHKYLEIELTETTTDVEFRDLKRVVGSLQQAGIHTSVDDFGMGYSSLNLIRDIPWDVMKIDRSFLPIDGDDSDSSRSIMFKHVVAMAGNMGLECIAEGVETQNQLDILRENRCALAQGFLFDPPLPVEKFEARMKEGAYPVYYSDEQ
ncbi:MAG: EAL domain-containing protein [Ruminococcus sp.]|nr:EAL domain-containing protein [Ruminococcus sp.]